VAPARRRVARTVLSNGLTVLASEARSLPIVTVVLSFEAGSRYDPDGKAGLAALVSSLVVEGSESLSAEEVALRVDSMGASLESGAGYETGSIAFTGLSSDRDDGLRLMLDLVRTPRFDVVSIEDATRRQIAEIADEDEDPYSISRRELFRMVFPKHPRGNPVTGYVGTVRAVSRDDLLGFHRARYRPGGATLAIAGDIDAGEALEKAARVFEEWPAGDASPVAFELPARSRGVTTRLVDVERKQVHLSIGNVGIARSDPDYYAVAVLDVILGDSAGFGSRLATRLREVEGLAYIVESDASGTAGRDPGIFWAYTATSPENVHAALRGILAELDAIRRLPPSADEVSSAAAYLRGRQSLERETNEVRAARLIAIERFALGLDYEEAYAGIVGAVTADEVVEAARRVIDLDGYCLVAVGPDVSTLLG
jgi:zinc protease